MNRYVKWLCLVAACWANSFQTADAQVDESGKAIKLSVADFIEFWSPSLLLAYEHPLADRFSIQAEGGYIGYFGGDQQDNQLSLRGFKTRLEFRHYFIWKRPNDYIGLQFMFKKTREDRRDNFCRDDCNFFQELDYHLDNTVFAFHFSNGRKSFIGNHFFVDWGYFVGFRRYNRETSGVPDDATLLEQGIGVRLWEFGKHWLPSVGLTFKVGFGW
ncbi:MAG: hypothetical protein AAB316_04095 [Bacteroidota bacterium]